MELVGVLILLAFMLNGCGSGSSGSSDTGSSGSTGPCAASPDSCALTSVAYGAGVFVAVGQGGALRNSVDAEPWIEVSTDGINWTPENIQYTSAQLNQAYELQSVTYGKNGFVATDGVHVLHSTKGINWSVESFQDKSDGIVYVIYDGTRYILYRNNSSYSTPSLPNSPWKVSTDGVNWTDYGKITVTNGDAGEPVWIIHVGGKYEAAWQTQGDATSSTASQSATSMDGLSWTLDNPVTDLPNFITHTMYYILYTGDQYILFGSAFSGASNSGVALYGSSLSAMTAVEPLNGPDNQDFYPTGDPLYGNNGLVSNGTVTVGLGVPGLFVTTDGITWNHEGMDGVVPYTECAGYHQPNSCTGFSSAAAAPGGPIVVLVSDGSAGAETTDGVNWVKSNL